MRYLSADLFSYYKLEDNVLDSSGNGYDAIAASGFSYAAAKHNKGALVGTSPTATISQAFPAANSCSVSFWAKGTTTKAYAPFVCDDFENFGISTHSSGDRLQLYMKDLTDNQGEVFYTENAFVDSAWRHYVVTWESDGIADGVCKMYVNGESRSAYKVYNTHPKTIAACNNMRIFGRGWSGRAYLDNGMMMDELALWTTTLTQTDVTALYNSGIGSFLM